MKTITREEYEALEEIVTANAKGVCREKGAYATGGVCTGCGEMYRIVRRDGLKTYQDRPNCPKCGCNGWIDLLVAPARKAKAK